MSEAERKPEAGGEGEPSMEEILASIRRIIISEDEEGADRSAVPTPRKAQSGAEEDVLELTEVVEESPAAVAEARQEPAGKVAPPPQPEQPQEERMERPLEAAPEPTKTEAAALVRESGLEEGLVSAATAAATTAALARLARTVSKPEKEAAPPAGGPTLEQFVAELLRPMLKAWLDANLPAIVERIVEREVQKLVRRAELL